MDYDNRPLYDRPARRAIDPRTVPGAVSLAGILLVAVAGVLAVFAAVDAMDDDPDRLAGEPATTTGVVVLLLGLLLLGCAWMAWTGLTPTAGVLSLVTAIILFVLFPESAALLALLGGIALLLARAVPDRRFA